MYTSPRGVLSTNLRGESLFMKHNLMASISVSKERVFYRKRLFVSIGNKKRSKTYK